MPIKDEEEYKDRLERARRLRNSVGMITEKDKNENEMGINLKSSSTQAVNTPVNSLNDNSITDINSDYENKLQRARELRNSIGMITQKDKEIEQEDKQIDVNTNTNANANTDINNNENKNNSSQQVKDNEQLNSPEDYSEILKKMDTEELKENGFTEEQIKYIKEADTDEGFFSSWGKIVENLWLGAWDGMKNFASYLPNLTEFATGKEQNKSILSAGTIANSNKIANIVQKAQENEKEDKLLINAYTQKTKEETPKVIALEEENGAKPILNQETEKNINNELEKYTHPNGDVEVNPIQETIKKDQEKIASNINQISSKEHPALKKISELAPSMGNSLVGGGLMLIPGVGKGISAAYFMISAAGSYEADGRNRGMTEDEAKVYGGIMGIMEGATETISVQQLGAGGSALGKGAIKSALKYYGLSMADNAIQEAIIDPIDEFTSNAVSGKTRHDYSTSEGWSQLGQDMIKDGIDGALSALLLDGMNAGLNAPTAVYNKVKNNQHVSQQELQNAYKEIQDSDIDIENEFQKSIDFEMQKIKNHNGTYRITNTDNSGNIIGIQEANGELIDFNNDKINIVPAVVYNDGYYNVIDAKTGTKLDTTPYKNKQNAIDGFNDKISNIDNGTINNINNQVTKMQISLANKIQEIEKNALENPEEFNTNTYIKLANNERIFSQQELVDYLTEQERKNQPKTPSQNLRDVIGQIQDKSIYSNKRTNEIMNSIANKFDNVSYTNSKLTVTDNQGNIKYSKDIKTNQPSYTGKTIKNILSNVYNNVMSENNNVNVPQTSSEQNASTFYTNKDNNYTNDTGYAVQDIKKVTQPFDAQETYSKDEMADVWNNSIAQNNYDAYYGKDGNIERYIAIEEEGDNLVVNQYDSNDNIVKSEVIPSENGRYSSKAIKDTIEKVSSLYDENRPIKGQQDIEGNEVLSMKKKLDNKKDTKITKKIEEFIAKNPNLETKINVSTNIVDDINIKEIKQMEAYKTARDLFSQIHKRKFKNNSTEANIYVTNSDIKESINTTYTYAEQRKYLKENIAIYSQLDNIIENAELISNTNELKGRQNYQLWEYYAMPVNIDNNKFIVQFDTVQREDGETHFRVQRLYKITEEGSSTTVVPTKKSATRFTVEPPSTKNSISQNNKTVKTDIEQKRNKSKIQKEIKTLEDIKAKYKNQTDQLNIFENKDNTISINNLVVKKNLRNKGIGQNILNDIINYADKNNKTITLTPTSEYLTKSKLTNWYKRNGFVENKGKNTDFSISDTMYRLAKNNTQNNQNIKDDGVRSMKKNANRTPKNNIINNLMKDIILKEKDNFKSTIKIDTNVVDKTAKIALNYNKVGQSTLSNIAKRLFNNLHKNVLNNKAEKIYVTNSDINESIAQTLKNPDQKALLKDNLSVFSQLDKIIENSKEIKSSETEITDNKSRTQYKDYKYYYTQAYIDGEQTWIQFDTRVQKGTTGKDERHFRLERIYKINEVSSNGGTENSITHFSNEPTSNTSIAQNSQLVKNDDVRSMRKSNSKNNTTQITTTVDNQGRTLSKQQQEYFKDSKVRDENGNLLVMYHGTEANVGLPDDYWFTIFDIDKAGSHGNMLGDGFYFTSDRSHAEQYAHTKGNIYETYLNIKNPLNLNNFSTGDLTYAIRYINPYIEADIYKRDGTIDGYKVRRYLLDNGYDGIHAGNTYVAFYSNQIKNVTNTNPTSNEDLRFAKKTAKPEGEILNPGATNAQREGSYIEQEIRKIEQTGNWDNSIPVTKMTDIRKTIEDYLGLGVQKGHFREQAYGIYKGNRDVIRTKELKDIDTILHETGHALDIGKRINLNKESISNELLNAVNKYGGYEAETREIQLEEGFAEVIREYSIVPDQAKIDYPQTVSVIEGIMQENTDFNNFMKTVQQQTYNYIHQNPRNRILSNQSIGETTKRTPSNLKQEIMRNVYDKDWAVKSAVNEMQKLNGKTTQDLKASENAYYLTRLASGIGDKVTSMLSKGYIDENGNKLMPGLDNIGELLNNNPDRFNDLRTLLAANRDLDYKAKTLKTGMRTSDAMAVREQFKNDIPLQESAKLFYDTLDGVLQYTVNNGLITQENADMIRKSNAFYAPMQRVLEGNRNNVGRKGAVADIIKTRTGSELDIKDVLENAISNSVNMIQQVENNNILKAFYKQGEQAGMTGKIYDIIPPPMKKIGTAQLATWETELRKQGVDTSKIDLEKTIDLFAPNNKVDSNNLITSFINDDGKRVYLQFHDEILFNSLMNMDKTFMSAVLNINRKLNMPLRYGATMANLGFAIPNVISDTAQAAIFSEAGFIPVLDNVIGVMDIVSAQNKGAREFFNKIMPGYADRINTLYAIYEQTGATNSTRMSQYRESTQITMKDVYGTKNSEVLGIKEKYKPLKRLLDILTYIPEISEQSTRFRVFEKNLEYYRRNGMAETDARIQAALQSRDATQDFSRTGNITREINQLIPFSAARVGSAYTFAEKVKANPKRVASRMAVLMAISMAIKAIGYDDKEIEELNQRKKDDNFVFKIGDQIITIKKPQGILRSIINLGEYIQDLFTGHIEEGKEGERLVEWVTNSIMDNMPADSVTGLVPNMIAPVVENAINKDLYYNSDIVKSYDLELPDSEQYYDYNSQLAIWLGKIFNYSPAKIDNLISGYFAGLGTSVTNVIDWISGKTGISPEEPDNGLEDNAVGKRFFVNVNTNSQSVDEIYSLKTDLTKKANGGTITAEEKKQLEAVTEAISNISKLNKQVKEIKADLSMSGKEKAEQIEILQQQKVDTARQALGKELLYSENQERIEDTKFYPTRDSLSQNKRTLTLTPEMKKEYEELASEYYKKYEQQGLYSEEKLEQLKSKAKEYAKKSLMKKYRNELVKDE